MKGVIQLEVRGYMAPGKMQQMRKEGKVRAV